jgi:hypothetical protein
LPVAVPVSIPFRRAVAPVSAKAAEKAGEFLIEYGFDGRADVVPRPLLDRVKPASQASGARWLTAGFMDTRIGS